MRDLVLIERSKIYLKQLSEGIHPVLGVPIPCDSAFIDEKVKKCFSFVSQILDDYVELLEKIEKLEKEKVTVVLQEKQKFSLTQEQSGRIALSKTPIAISAFMKNINSVIDASTTEKITSTQINAWLQKRGYVTMTKVPRLINRSVYTPSDFAKRLGIVEEITVDKSSGEAKSQIKLTETAQLFILENVADIVNTK